ncbi:Uncharacterized conserved protein, DUF2267 family [Haloechinothrix alba]|uniref:Uncharacterized conserved protein, DUF2267 family n=1 Tax=Haloechinothrix alba TaxID=664784 RepID=A0A238ZCF6_9PSEU|nr:DUF2267 domain-containing protein [Haloechinothrix alba]SNR81206.1 Uncharacterized conserved protein, DUF2267 family [Haloechinothrix alba]
MRHEEMLDELQHRGQVDRERAERMLAATVQAMSEIAPDSMAQLRGRLPAELTTIEPAFPAPERSVEEFVIRVGELAGTADTPEARRCAYAAFGVVCESVPADQLRRLLENVPQEFTSMAPSIIGLSADAETLLAQVRQLTSADSLERSRELTEAVLGVLAENITGRQADDLAAGLPSELRSALATGTHAERTEPDRFFAEVDRLTGTMDTDRTREDVGHVFTVVRRWAPDELDRSLAQLPTEIAAPAG